MHKLSYLVINVTLLPSIRHDYIMIHLEILGRRTPKQIEVGGWGVSPAGKSEWSLHACDPVAGVEPENSAPGLGRALGFGAVKSC